MRNRNENYDREADILYISNKDNRPAIGEEPIDGVIIRRAVDNNEIVGITIFDIKKLVNIGYIPYHDVEEFYPEEEE